MRCCNLIGAIKNHHDAPTQGDHQPTQPENEVLVRETTTEKSLSVQFQLDQDRKGQLLHPNSRMRFQIFSLLLATTAPVSSTRAGFEFDLCGWRGRFWNGEIGEIGPNPKAMAAC